MKNLVLLQVDLDIQEVDLSEIKGGLGNDVYPSGCGKDGRTGEMACEFLIMFEDGSFEHIFLP